MSVDLEKYRKYVERFDLTEEQKEELLRVVWIIVERFVQRGFEQPHPPQKLE